MLGTALLLKWLAGLAALSGLAVFAFLRLRRRKGPAFREKPGTVLGGKYRLERPLGQGTMSEVWEAVELASGRKVAVKAEDMGALGSQARDYYLREARTLNSLRHPNIVGLYDVLNLDSGLYLVFELVSGRSAQQILSQNKRLSLEEAREILRPVCEALSYAHQQGVVHRDLKPANIMVTAEGAVKVMDYGVARHVNEGGAGNVAVSYGKHQWAEAIVGTPAYMAPETQKGRVGLSCDVYALGICLYELLTGSPPYQTHSFYLKKDRTYVAASARVPGLPAEADRLIYDALDPDPATRIASAKDFLARLDNLGHS